ncbi:MAG: tRNA glutamyl-Q(34) synthetase GluQRS [Thiogranum sp.]
MHPVDNKTYRGRFAPSPTGPLHFGSLIAAVGSFLDARSCGGEWLVRMEDLDPPREVSGAADDILRTLEAFGLYWDSEVMYQSQRHNAYQQALERLEHAQLVYPCGCSRKDIQENALRMGSGDVYPGTCRNGLPQGREARALRLRVPDLAVRFRDRLQGNSEEWLPEKSGDFIIRRADGLFAYQLAVVVDDAEQGITDVVRGADLLDSTCRQIFLLQSLGCAIPRYLHLPVAVNENGEKLSKQTNAPAVSPQRAVSALTAALRFLGQRIPAGLEDSQLADFWDWAVPNWKSGRIPDTRMIEEH